MLLSQAHVHTGFEHRHFYTQKPLHTEAFTHTHTNLYTQTLSHTHAFTHGLLYTQALLQTGFTHSRFYTKKFFTLFHKKVFTQRRMNTQRFSDAFTHSSFTRGQFHTRPLLHTQMPLQTNTLTLLRKGGFTHKRFGTQTLFAHRCSWTKTLLHTDSFTHRLRQAPLVSFTHRRYCHRRIYTQAL